MIDRRQLLAWFAASPLLTSQENPISDAAQAINVMDFEPAARKALPPAHWGYMATGVEDDLTLKANRKGFERLYLRPRRLIDVSKVDTKTEVFGQQWDAPIALAPIGNMMAFRAQAESLVARACRATNTHQILSTVTNTPIGSVNEALGRPVWFQLYPTSRWAVTEQLVHRAVSAGSNVIVLTVDTQAGSRRETFERLRKLDSRDCKACHGTSRADFYRRKPMFQGIDITDLPVSNAALTWKHVGLLRKLNAGGKLLIKGIETHEDARLCIESGADGIIVSNHGGRAEESGRGTIDCLPEVVDAAAGRVPVLIDGGFRRGSDVFKALALGARAVCIGRPYLWGLSAFGQLGVERVIRMIGAEFELVMKQCGARSIAEISPKHVGRFGA